MAMRYKTKFDRTPKMAVNAEKLDGKKLNVGVFSGEHQWLAGIHEWGCIIPVTARMRAYLHRIGVHLQKSTTQIIIPERSFLRSGYDTNRDSVLGKAEKVLPDVLDGTMSEDQYFEIVGTALRDAIKEYAIDLKSPPKQDWPTRPPGFDNPLVQTGDMINGIEYEVTK